MSEIDEARLAGLALGLRDEPELRAAPGCTPKLRAQPREISSTASGLDREFGLLLAERQRSSRKLSPEPWSILLAIDSSEPARRAARSAATLAQASDGEVVVFHAREITPVRMGQSLESSAEAARLVESVAAALCDLGVRAQGVALPVREGRAASAILAAAELLHSDVIVMGSRGFSRLAGLFLGSVSQKILPAAPCPVLVVR